MTSTTTTHLGVRPGPQTAQTATVTVPVSVIVPTRNEALNIDPLLERLTTVLRGTPAEVIIVDDSDDETPTAVQRHIVHQPRRTVSRPRVRLIHREPHQRAGGLGTAVVAGLRQARGTWVVVMDGDLQHPPETIPRLIDAGERTGVDVVVASRHVDGGDSSGLDGASRALVSNWATLAAKTLFPRVLHGVSDPMSGFFAVRRDAVDPDRLQPDGFKILLEILARHPGLRRTEVGFTFDERHAGESKASLREGLRFAHQLLVLSTSRLTPRQAAVGRALAFGLVGATGIVVNTLALWVLSDPSMLALSYLLGAIIATQVSTTWNYVLIDRLVYRGAKSRRWWHRYLLFSATNNLVLLARIPVLALLVGIGTNYLLANAVTLLASFAVRFATSDRIVYRSEKS